MDSTPKRAARPYRAGVASILLGLASGAQSLILLVGLYTDKVFSGYLRVMCISEPLTAAASIVCAAIALHPFITQGFREGIAATRRAGSASLLALAGLAISVIATVCLAFLFVIAMGLE